jgi:signal transduction histidine kinase
VLVDWLHRHPRAVDWALFLIAAATTVGAAAHHDRRGLGIPIAAVACLPLLARRQHPLPVLAATAAPTVAILAVWSSYTPFPVGVALYTVAERCDRRTSLAAGGATVAVLALPLLAASGGFQPHVLGEVLGFAAAWLIGDSVRSRRQYLAALEERAERLERERETDAARAVAEEQARIARELHDVIAHTLSVIVVQAAAARDVLASQPERAGEALAAVEAAARGALGELRRLLSTVRGDATFAPQPGLEQLDELVRQVRAAGLEVAITIEGTQSPLPPTLDLSAYRVVQEALTNTLKHAHATHVDVALSYGPAELRVEVRDDGAAAANGDGDGRGLIGMRERVSAFGGSLAAGPGPSGGYVVSARFPLVGST